MSLMRQDLGAIAVSDHQITAQPGGQPFAVLEERLHAAMTQQRRRMEQGDQRLKAMREAIQRVEKEIVDGNADLARGEEHARMLDDSLAGLRIQKAKLAQAIEVVTERMQQEEELKEKREAARLEHVSQLNALTAQLAAAHDDLTQQADRQRQGADDPKFNPTLASELRADIEGLEAALSAAKAALAPRTESSGAPHADRQSDAFEKVFIACERFAQTSGLARMEIDEEGADRAGRTPGASSAQPERAQSALDRLWEASPRALAL